MLGSILFIKILNNIIGSCDITSFRLFAFFKSPPHCGYAFSIEIFCAVSMLCLIVSLFCLINISCAQGSNVTAQNICPVFLHFYKSLDTRGEVYLVRGDGQKCLFLCKHGRKGCENVNTHIKEKKVVICVGLLVGVKIVTDELALVAANSHVMLCAGIEYYILIGRWGSFVPWLDKIMRLLHSNGARGQASM